MKTKVTTTPKNIKKRRSYLYKKTMNTKSFNSIATKLIFLHPTVPTETTLPT